MKKILIIEDNQDSREIFKTILERSGFSVDEASDGEQALEMIKDGIYSVILVDLSLPKVSGWDIIKESKRANPSVPIIAVTAHAMSGDRENVLKAGCDDYISKPLKPSDLVEKVKKYARAE